MIRDWIRAVLGTATSHEATKKADPEDLIALGRVSVSVETAMGYEPATEAGVAFADVKTKDFKDSLDEVKQVISNADGTKQPDVERTDSKGNKWIVINDHNVNSLTANLQYAASAMESVDKSARLLAAVMPFQKDNEKAYIIYSFRRGKFYPFIPKGTSERYRKEEERMAGIIKDEIDIESERKYWYPMWPKKPNTYPWEK
jgi:hypothetical protein